MSLERLVEEIRQRAEEEIGTERSKLEGERRRIAEDRDRRIETAEKEAREVGELDAARERAKRLARARLEARRKVFEARGARSDEELARVRSILVEFTRTPGYAALLKQMYARSTEELGKKLKVSGRAEDAALLRSVAGKSFSPEATPIMGGLISETPEGDRRLNLSFDELLRLRGDRVRAILAS